MCASQWLFGPFPFASTTVVHAKEYFDIVYQYCEGEDALVTHTLMLMSSKAFSQRIASVLMSA